MRLRLVVLIVVAFIALTLALSSSAVAFEGDCRGIVTRVVDGDTIYIKCMSGFKAGEVFKVRFADVNAPELGTPEGEIAKSALYNLVYGKTVILDVDDVYIYDRYGRVVAVVYLELNETTLLNVNLWLVVNGYAEITDYPNEFNPYSWSLCVTLAHIPSRLTWIERDLPGKPIDVGEAFTVVLTKDLSRIVLPAIYSIDELKVYEVVPPGIEVLDSGPGRLIRIRLDELREHVSGKVVDVISEFRENISMGIVKIPEIPYLPDLLPRGCDYVTLIEFDFTNIDEAVYKARVVDVAPYEPLKVFHGATLMIVKDTSGREYGIPGVIGGDPFLWVKPPVRILASTSSKVEIVLRFHKVHERGLKSIILNLTRKLAPELNYIEIWLDKPFTTSIPIIANLSDFTENGRLTRSIDLTIVNETDNTMIRVVLPQDLKLSMPIFTIKPIVAPPSTPPWIVRAMPVIDISMPSRAPSKPVKIEFKYDEGMVRALGLREDLLKIIYFNEDLGAWVSIPSNVDPSRNIVWAYVSHFTMFSIAQLSSGVEGYVLDEATGEPIQGAKIIAISDSKIAEATTDEKGHYYISLAPGTYTIIVSARGYADDASRTSVSLGEISRLDFNLKRATAEFEGSWVDVKFELAIITNSTWEIGKTVNLTASIVVTDMGDYREVSFETLKLTLSGIEVTMPIDATLQSPGKAFTKTIEINVMNEFSFLEPGTSDSYRLWIDLQGSITSKYGVTASEFLYDTMSINVYAPPIPLTIKAEMPETIYIGDEFNITIRLRNDGQWPITDIELKLLTPFGIDLLSLSEWSLAQLDPGGEAKATFKLKASLATTSSVEISLAYTTFYGYREYEYGKEIALLTIRKIPTSITITVEPAEVDVGGEVIIKGSITPPISTQIMLTIKKPDGTTETMTTTSGVDGGFSFKVKLDQEGTWTFIASYSGSTTYEESVSTSVQATAKPKRCLIATAAFGTELAAPVQFLREFRDQVVMGTFAGKCFMEAFNTWYYSWAPYVAQAEWSCEPLRQAIKYAIYPLIGILHVATATYNILSINPEAAIITAGIVASALISLAYLTPITLATSIALNKRPSRRTIKATLTAWLITLIATAISVIVKSPELAITATPTLALTTIALTAIATTAIITSKIKT